MSTSEIVLQGDAYNNFVYTIKSKKTLKTYDLCIRYFMKFCNITDVDNLLVLAKDPLEIQRKVIDYVMTMRRREMSSVAINMYLAAIMHFYSMNDITLNRKKIGRYIPAKVRKQKDRPYTREEISKMLQFCDIRSRALILLFCSTGMRTGAVPDLTLQHIQKIEKCKLYKFTVYYGTETCLTMRWPSISYNLVLDSGGFV